MCKAIAWPDSTEVLALDLALGTLLAMVRGEARAVGWAAALVAVHLGRVLKPIVQNARAACISQRHLQPLGVNFNDREGCWSNSQATFSSRSKSSRSTCFLGRKEQRPGFCLLLGTKVREEGSGKIHCSLSYPFDCQHQLTTGVQ